LSSGAYRVLGRETVRKDGAAKVTGREVYASDFALPGMLHARVLKSPHPHARVRSIDTSAAEGMGATVVTFEEVPEVTFCPRLVSTPEATYKDWRVMTGRPRYVGEAVAAVAAESEGEAQRALEALRVEYDPLPAVYDALESMEPGKQPIHEEIVLKDQGLRVENNVACQVEISEGDVDRGFAEADVVLERTYRTSRRYHDQMETKAVVVRPEVDGGLTLWSTTQTIHNTRLLLHEIFGIPMAKIRVVKMPLGSSFGSSIQVNTIVPIAVALALKTRRPVRLAFTREEDLHDHCSYQMTFRLKLGARMDGTLTAGHLEAVLDIGAHQIQAYPLLGCVVGWWVSLYKLPHKSYVGRAVYTNKVPSCAFRGYGNPQISWAVETMMDEVAEAVGMDPLDFRLRNYIGQGDLFWGQGPTVKSVIQSCGVEEILRRGAEMVDWYARPRPGEQTGRYRRGLGVGRGFHTSSAGAPVPGTVVDFGGAILKLNEDGTLDYVTALMEHGGGTLEAHAKIIAEELHVPLGNVQIVQTDTGTSLYDVCTHASRGIYSGGGAALKVARQVKERIQEYAGRLLDANPPAVKLRCDDERGQGVAYVEGVEGRELTYEEIASTARHKNWATVASLDSYRQPSCPPHFTGYFVEVEVDTWTGRVRLERVVAGADIGTVINPLLAAGQVHGGFAMGWSMATLEDTPYDPGSGELLNRGYVTDYKVPTPREMPDLEDFTVFFADTYEPTGPFGAKGIGEGALNPVAGAVANAIQNALGIRFYELPITPERILRAISEREGSR
jgi:xanthine dehydrogenase molybdenum-binding subunit